MPRSTPRPQAEDRTLGLFLTPDGKLPPFAQRRLDDLLARNQLGQLTRAERRELREAVDYVERKTLLMLTRTAHPSKKRSRTTR